MYYFKPISILDNNNQVELFKASYTIDVLGGFFISANKFKVVLTNVKSGRKIDIKRAKWPIQSFEFKKRAKRYFQFTVEEKGTYKVQFKHPYDLEVKKSNLFPIYILSKPIPTEKISILIKKRF